MKILVLSHSEWDDANSFGSSFSNILGDIDSIELANVYCRTGKPNTNSCNVFFQITEKSLIKNLIFYRNPSGQIVKRSSPAITEFDTNPDHGSIWINFVKKTRWIVFFWLRDLIWYIGRWKSNELKKSKNCKSHR